MANNVNWREEAAAAWQLFRITLEEWNADNATRLSAALAYYTIFAIAPLLIIAMAVAGLVLGPDAVQGQLGREMASYLNNRATAEFVQTLIKNTSTPKANIFATIIGVIMLFYGATGVFSELKSSLNTIWDVPAKPVTGLRDLIIDRMLALIVVMISGFLLLLSLVVSTFVTAAQGWLNTHAPVLSTLSQTINFWFFFLITLMVFALIYKFLPDIRIAWRDVWIGAVATTLLFSLGRLLISLYLSYSTVESTYGAAGSLAALLLWIFYSAEIFFLGAEFTQVYGRTKGSRRRELEILEESIEAAEQVADGAATPMAASAPLRQTEQAPQAKQPDTQRGKRRNLARPLVELVTAVGIIGALSVINIIFQPFRR